MMNEKPLVFKPKRCKKCGLEFDLIVISFEKFNNAAKYCPNCAAEIETLQNKITYQPVDDYKKCNFYKDGKKRDILEVDDYYMQPYCDNPFREGKMSGLWGEYEYYCPKCNLEITKVFYDSEHIKVGDCSKCPKYKESDYMNKILYSCCYTCKHYDGTNCNRLNFASDEDFICDFFKRKNSGAFRRKLRKAKKEIEE